MRQLVILVGLPGSGKTSVYEQKADWIVVSKNAIRQSVFRCSYEPSVEGIVDRIFSTTLIETAESCAEVVCVDDLNLLRQERRSYIELGQMTQREPIAIVMPYSPIDEMYQRVQLQLEELANRSPKMNVSAFPRDRFDALLRCYEAVQPNEGFARIHYEKMLPVVSGIAQPENAVRRERRKREEKKNPIPLFAV